MQLRLWWLWDLLLKLLLLLKLELLIWLLGVGDGHISTNPEAQTLLRAHPLALLNELLVIILHLLG